MSLFCSRNYLIRMYVGLQGPFFGASYTAILIMNEAVSWPFAYQVGPAVFVNSDSSILSGKFGIFVRGIGRCVVLVSKLVWKPVQISAFKLFFVS